MVPDPNPVTVNANRSDDVTRLTGELSDTDYANVTSGSSLQRQIMPGGHLLGMDNSATQGLSGNNGLGAQGGSTSGSGISNTVNRGLQQGLAPLRILTGGSR
ncbi:hypothetical protein D3C78_1593460 [compost metagenome]